MKHIGTVVRGIKTPIITKNMNLKEVVVNSLLDASTEGNFSFNDKDVVAINVGCMKPWMNYEPRSLKELLGGTV